MPRTAPKHAAIYVRVSSDDQRHRSQLPDLRRWAEVRDEPVKWYEDKATGKVMDRPGWNALMKDVRAGKVSAVVCWRLDRLGRNTAGVAALLDELRERKVKLVSVTEGIDFGTAIGKAVASILAALAEWETEVRGERVKAGQAAARKAGKRWGGGVPGRRKVTPAKERTIRRLKADGETVAAICREVGLSRPTVYSVLNEPAAA
ncbi:recombinase family protein [Alienimonas sp. DA493]|uniref:recombinase family protein n=1 Tax=Alienimonas sp. DA493 TaxID=3373605 RepID=UPI003754C4EB